MHKQKKKKQKSKSPWAPVPECTRIAHLSRAIYALLFHLSMEHPLNALETRAFSIPSTFTSNVEKYKGSTEVGKERYDINKTW